MFNRRRVSRDREVTADICRELCGGTLYIAEYSRSLFSDSGVPFVASDSFLDLASQNDLCFVENNALAPYADRIDRLIIYKWNRRYPSDVKLDIVPENIGLKLSSVTEFAGYSHEKITKEIYVR